MQLKKIVLASGSKFKERIFKEFADEIQLEVDFNIMPSSLGDKEERDIIDNIIRGEKDISLELAKKATHTLAYKKALDVFNKLNKPVDTLIIGADSSILFENTILDKYKSSEEAYGILHRLCNSDHHVLTGMAFVSENKEHSITDVVAMNPKGASAECCKNWVLEFGKEKICSVCGYTMANGLQQILNVAEEDYNTVIGLSTRAIKDYLSNFES